MERIIFTMKSGHTIEVLDHWIDIESNCAGSEGWPESVAFDRNELDELIEILEKCKALLNAR